jgi:hypothetical protein
LEDAEVAGDKEDPGRVLLLHLVQRPKEFGWRKAAIAHRHLRLVVLHGRSIPDGEEARYQVTNEGSVILGSGHSMQGALSFLGLLSGLLTG